MAKRSAKKPSDSTHGPSAARDGGQVKKADAIAAKARFGWKSPLALAAVVAVAAGASIYYKMSSRGGGSSPAESLVIADTPQSEFTDNTGAEAGYIGSESCAQCHEGIAESYSHIAMGRSLYPPNANNIIEDYEKNNEFYHEASRQHFRMTHENGKFYQTRFQKDPSGNVINEKKVEISYVVGSGNHSRSYVHREADGKMYQLPIAWYSQDKKWAMNPGYDSAHHINFSRRITYDCIFCHAAYPDVEAGADQYNYGESSWFPEKLEAIDCERCHGPAAEHVKLAKGSGTQTAIKDAIVNPANLDNKLQLEVCMQCHLETTSGQLPHSVHTVGKGIFGYRPGEPLEHYRYAFDHPPGTGHDDKFEIAGQAYRMRMSPCFIKSEGKMTCTTCHDPHRVPKDRTAAAIQSCFECHQPKDCTEKMELRLPVQDNCIQCHMPQRRTDDVIHAVMTDHFIQRRPSPPEQLLAPKKEHSAPYKGDVLPYYPKEISPEVRDLYLGIAHISNSADLQKGVKHLDAYLQKNPTGFEALYTRGVALKMLGQLDRARTELEESVKLRPHHPQAWMALGDLYEMMQNYKRSVECYNHAVKLNPKLSRAYNGAGTSLLMAGDLAAAEKSFRAAIVQDPFDENPRLNLAGIYLRRGEMKAAEAEARAALAINPGSASAWLHLSQCALHNNKTNEAIWTSLESLSADPNGAEAADILFTACRRGEPDAVKQSLQSVVNRAPFAAQVALAMVLIGNGETATAGQSLSSAGGATTCGAVMPMAIQAAAMATRPELALLWGEQAYTAAPEDEEAMIRYTGALQVNGRNAQAEGLLKQALARQRSPRLLNALAWLRATSRDDGLRSGQEAVQLSDEAARMLEKPNVFILQSQAAAAAEQGNFEQAMALAGSALDMAKDARLLLEAKKIEEQLATYKMGKPYRR